MKKYEGKNSIKIKTVYCNRCGKIIKTDKGIVMEGICSVNQLWGYFSMKDGQRHSFDLCESCYDAITRDFIIPVENIDEKEMI